jgi:hypothetical protein
MFLKPAIFTNMICLFQPNKMIPRMFGFHRIYYITECSGIILNAITCKIWGTVITCRPSSSVNLYILIFFSQSSGPSFVLISPVVSEKKIKNRPHPFYTFGFLLCTSDQQQNIKTFKGPSNDPCKIEVVHFLYIACLFSSSDPKGHLRYCHHLSSIVVCKLIYFNLLLWIQWPKLGRNDH